MSRRCAARGMPARTVAAGVIGTLLLTGCASFTERRDRAERLLQAPAVLGELGSFTGRLSVTARLRDARGLGAAARTEAKKEEKRVVTVQVDLGRDLAAYTALGATKPSRVFSGLRLYGLRPDARPDDARPWVRINAARISDPRALDPQESAPVTGIDVLPPTLLVDLAAGALAGSVRDLGAGPAGHHYSANVDVAKALRKSTRRDFDDKQQRDVIDLLTTMGVLEDDLHKGEFWLDDEGVLRRLVLRLREEPLKNVVYEVEFDLELVKTGVPVSIRRPTQEQEVVVPSVSQFLTALAPVVASPSPSPTPQGG